MSYPIFSAVVEDDTLPILFATYGGTNGESVTMTGLAVTDVEIYKDGSITQRSSDAGISLIDTDGIDVDSVTGIHGFTIDLSDNTDAGFYAVDSWYHVVVSSVTVDSQTVSFVAAAFRIVSATRGTAGTALPAAAADAAGGLAISDAGGLDLDSIKTDTAAILVDTGTNGVALLAATQASIDAIELDTGTTIPGTIATAQADLDIITGASGVNLLTATQASIDAIEADTNELQGDNVPGLIATAQADLDIITGATGVNLLAATQASIDAIELDTGTTIPATITTAQADLDVITGASGVNLLTATQASIDAIEADTNELQGDWVDGGRLDAILDLVATAASVAGVQTVVDALQKLAEADIVYDKTTDAAAHRTHIYEKGTTTDLTAAKLLKDADGAAIAASTTPVASMQQA